MAKAKYDLSLIPGYDPHKNSDDFWFDDETATTAIRFFEEALTHIKGELAGKPFLLEPWQKSILANLLGWKRKKDNTRRYREAFIEVPRKNGKTTLVAGIAVYCFLCDGEPGAEVYCAAGERDQAKILWDLSKQMMLANKDLSSFIKPYQHSITIPESNSFFKYTSADAGTKHGFSPHLAVIDELHVQKSPELLETLETGVGSRRNPLIISITTSDYERVSVCNQREDYAMKVRDGIVEDPYFLPVIYAATVEDDWTSEETWKKANPCYGVSLKKDYIEKACKRAQEEPEYENTFKRLHLNIRTEQAVRWIDMQRWVTCHEEFDLDQLKGEECIAGLDLSETEDISALVLMFPKFNNLILPFFWIPNDNIMLKEKKHHVPYSSWKQQGFIYATDGDVIDYQFIRKKINDLSKLYKFKEIAIDPWNSRQIANQLQDEDGFEIVEFRQGWKSMNEPCKHLNVLVKQNKINHLANPVMRWMASNVAVKIDPNGNIMIVKDRSQGKVDGIVALVMCIGRLIVDEIQKKSIYSSRGVFSI